jgi:hypothetical protein
MQPESVSSPSLDESAPENEIEEVWFDAPASSRTKRPSTNPPPEPVGEFLGDPLADAWLR